MSTTFNRRNNDPLDQVQLTRRQTVGTVIAGIALVSGVVYGANAVDKANDNKVLSNQAAVEQAAMNEADKAVNGVLVLHKGAKYRTAPIINNETDGLPGTIAGEVPAGQVMRLDRALLHRDESGDVWYGFTMPQVDDAESTNAANPEKLYWVSGALSGQNENGKPLMTHYDYASQNPASGPVDVAMAADGTFQYENKGPSPSIAQAVFMSEEAFAQEVQREDLQLALK